VWVGYDDYSDIKLSGAALAAPVWTEFMKRAIALPNYSDVKPFSPPAGVVQLSIDKITDLVATPACPNDYVMAFIEGTQPTQTCDQTMADHRNIFQKIFGMEAKPTPPPAVSNSAQPGVAQQQPANSAQQSDSGDDQDKPKKKGFFGRLFGGGKGDNKDKEKDKKPANPGAGSGPQ
jgi:penicillin-binding protein 1B